MPIPVNAPVAPKLAARRGGCGDRTRLSTSPGHPGVASGTQGSVEQLIFHLMLLIRDSAESFARFQGPFAWATRFFFL